MRWIRTIRELDLGLGGGLGAFRALDNVLLAGTRCANHLTERFPERVFLPGNVTLAEAGRTEVDDGGKIESMELAKSAAGVVDPAHVVDPFFVLTESPSQRVTPLTAFLRDIQDD